MSTLHYCYLAWQASRPAPAPLPEPVPFSLTSDQVKAVDDMAGLYEPQMPAQEAA